MTTGQLKAEYLRLHADYVSAPVGTSERDAAKVAANAALAAYIAAVRADAAAPPPVPYLSPALVAPPADGGETESEAHRTPVAARRRRGR